MLMQILYRYCNAISIQYIRPMYLKKGDTIAIVSPARAITSEEIQPAVHFFEKHGLQVVLGKHTHTIHHQMAGTDAEKVKDIQGFINNPSIRAIVSTRGGYGCVRVIDQLDLSPLAEQKKWFVGYSDVTVFHSHIHQNYGTPTIHGTMPVNISYDPSLEQQETNATLIAALMGKDLRYHIASNPMNKEGDASGLLVGGNLSMLYSMCGSVSDIDTRGKILFIEDLDEYLYHIDRMMINMKRTGKLEHLAALVVGGMSDMNDNKIPFGKTAEEIILEHTAAYDYPVYFGFQAGHKKLNVALRLGMRAELKDNQLFLPA
jgi:muramoyltetrapeptide carboxypeptidase